MFFLTGDIEKYGTGFTRINNALKNYPDINLILEEIGDFFRIKIIDTSSITKKTSEKIGL